MDGILAFDLFGKFSIDIKRGFARGHSSLPPVNKCDVIPAALLEDNRLEPDARPGRSDRCLENEIVGIFF
jgi:hypothetical protein